MGSFKVDADDMTKGAIQSLVTAIQMSVDSSPMVQGAVANLHRLGYIPNFTVKMDLELTRPMDEALTDTRVRMA
jgi:hypothetical protein